MENLYLLDQIQKQHAAAHVALGDGDHQTEVGLGHAVLGLLVALGHADGQGHLFLRGQQGHLADLFQVHAHGVVGGEGIHQRVGVGDLLLGDLLDLGQILHLGQHVILDGGQRVLAADVNVDAVLLQGLIELVLHLAVQVQILQNGQILDGEAPGLLALFQQLLQKLLGRLGGLRRRGVLFLAAALARLGQLGLLLGGDVVGVGLLQKLVGHALQFFLGEFHLVVHASSYPFLSLSFL